MISNNRCNGNLFISFATTTAALCFGRLVWRGRKVNLRRLTILSLLRFYYDDASSYCGVEKKSQGKAAHTLVFPREHRGSINGFECLSNSNHSQ